jgi:uncharacterized LabA/DUF88 family protein
MSKGEAIVFVDGNNIYHNLKGMHIKPSLLDFSKLSESVCEHFGCRHKKSRYYNSVPSIEVGEERYFKHATFLRSIENLPKFEVFRRKLQTCKGVVREKGIDVMIAVDMLNLSVIEKECDCCILVSGDADFIPASQIIKKHGKEVFSAFIPRGYSWELRKKLDFWTLSKGFLMENCMKGSSLG